MMFLEVQYLLTRESSMDKSVKFWNVIGNSVEDKVQSDAVENIWEV